MIIKIESKFFRQERSRTCHNSTVVSHIILIWANLCGTHIKRLYLYFSSSSSANQMLTALILFQNIAAVTIIKVFLRFVMWQWSLARLNANPFFFSIHFAQSIEKIKWKENRKRKKCNHKWIDFRILILILFAVCACVRVCFFSISCQNQ